MAKTKRRNKSKSFEIKFDDGCGGTCSFNPDEVWQADLTSINSIYYQLRLFDKSDRLICEVPVTWEQWQKLNLEKIIKENRSLLPKKYKVTMVRFLDINKKVHKKPLSELKSITGESKNGWSKFKVEFNAGKPLYVSEETFDFLRSCL